MVNKKRIVKLYRKGVSKRQIAIKCECSRAYVYEVLKKAETQEFLQGIFGNTVGGGL